MRALNITCSTSTTAQAGCSHWAPPRLQCCCAAHPVTKSAVYGTSTAGPKQQLNWQLPRAAADHLSTSVAGLAAAVLLLCPANAAYSHIAIDQLPQPQQQQEARLPQPTLPGSTAGFDPAAVGQIRARQPVDQSSSRSRRRQQSVTATEALEALQQLKASEGLFQQGDYAAALQGYTAVVQQHPDLALTEYARLGQALCMYQEGSTSQALTKLNELELDLRGNPETHAALAAVLYIERPAQRWRAEQQWDIAVGFDSRYQDVAWVQENKHWPPRLLDALDKFLSLR